MHVCERCGKIMTEKFGSGRFCSRACANSRLKTAAVKEKTSQATKKTKAPTHEDFVKKYYLNPNYCKICGKVLEFNLRFKTLCSRECVRQQNKENASKAGRISASVKIKRSKNEIYFYELCTQYFKDVKHNLPIFDG